MQSSPSTDVSQLCQELSLHGNIAAFLAWWHFCLNASMQGDCSCRQQTTAELSWSFWLSWVKARVDLKVESWIACPTMLVKQVCQSQLEWFVVVRVLGSHAEVSLLFMMEANVSWPLISFVIWCYLTILLIRRWATAGFCLTYGISPPNSLIDRVTRQFHNTIRQTCEVSIYSFDGIHMHGCSSVNTVLAYCYEYASRSHHWSVISWSAIMPSCWWLQQHRQTMRTNDWHQQLL